MIIEITLGLILLSVFAMILAYFNHIRIKNLEEDMHEEPSILYLMSTTFILLSVVLFGLYTFLNTSYANSLSIIPQQYVLAGFALFTLPLSVITLLVALFQHE